MVVPEIKAVREELDHLTEKGLITRWELPYENLLTRLDAALFFVEFAGGNDRRAECMASLDRFGQAAFEANGEQLLSSLPYQLTFVKRSLS